MKIKPPEAQAQPISPQMCTHPSARPRSLSHAAPKALKLIPRAGQGEQARRKFGPRPEFGAFAPTEFGASSDRPLHRPQAWRFCETWTKRSISSCGRVARGVRVGSGDVCSGAFVQEAGQRWRPNPEASENGRRGPIGAAKRILLSHAHATRGLDASNFWNAENYSESELGTRAEFGKA